MCLSSSTVSSKEAGMELRKRATISASEPKAKKNNPIHEIFHEGQNWRISEFFLGCIIASIFSLAYIATPLYVGIALVLPLFHPFQLGVYLLWVPVLLSFALPPLFLPQIWRNRTFRLAISTYFSYEQISEITEEELLQVMKERPLIFAALPHGVISYGGLASFVNRRVLKDTFVPVAVASAIYYAPFLRHLLGIFGIIPAEATLLERHLQSKSEEGVCGSLAVYSGGIAELFLSSSQSEALYIKKRKGFVRLALANGADIVPVYYMGNTTCLSVATLGGLLAAVSRRLKVSVTIMWGWCGFPIPRPTQQLCVRGALLGLPRVEEVTEELVDYWHARYVEEVQRLFDSYKKCHPDYKDKALVLV